MTDIEKQQLEERNNRIIEVILNEIQEKCPDAIDMIGIGGSFCNGDIYEKSDLDLVIIFNNGSAKCLDKCFIIDDIGYDVYTQDWNRFAKMAEYHHPYVTKLFDLKIVYKRNDDVLKQYQFYQGLVQTNMNNQEVVYKQVGEYFGSVLADFNSLQGATDLGLAYRHLSSIIKNIEFILFMINRTYVKRGTKRVPEEISSLEVLPENFLPVYHTITNSKTIEEIQNKSLLLVNAVKDMLDKFGISYKASEESTKDSSKKTITASDLIGTYEEIYSNWKNKMYHAASINSSYLSFVTISSCQEFYDEMANEFDIPRIELLKHFNPDDLYENAVAFGNALGEWKKLYDLFGIAIQHYRNLEEFENSFRGNAFPSKK